MTLTPAIASYRIEGKVNLGEEWQPQIYLAIIEHLSDYYRTSPELIVNTGLINADGTFVIEGDELPENQRFYRLYLMKEQNTEFDACLYMGRDDHNFIHIILDNDDQLSIKADSSYYAPFGNYTIEGTAENYLMRELSMMVYPSFYFYQIKFPTELRLSQEKLLNNLLAFSDTCSYAIVALAAITNTDMERYYEEHKAFYKRFGNRLVQEMPDAAYTQDYLRKISLYTGTTNKVPSWIYLIIAIQAIVIAYLFFDNVKLKKQQHIKEDQLLEKMESRATLTAKEQEILELIAIGKSNKEIASSLFIELSTVKTHINKIYTKLKVSNRKEAIQLLRQKLEIE